MGRKWGQHFLRSPKTVARILEAAQLDSESTVLEIGPGEGVLTFELCDRAKTVHAFEIDSQLAQRLGEKGRGNLVVHQGDFLKNTLESLSEQPLVVVANLPYYITAPIMERLTWANELQVTRAVLMMQEEVARRVCGEQSRAAGALTYIVGAYFKAEYVCKVPPGCFAPPPKVDSAVISLTPHDSARGEEYKRLYERLVSTAFQARRKQLGRSLRALNPQIGDILESSGIDSKRRPETLSVQEFWELARNLAHCE